MHKDEPYTPLCSAVVLEFLRECETQEEGVMSFSQLQSSHPWILPPPTAPRLFHISSTNTMRTFIPSYLSLIKSSALRANGLRAHSELELHESTRKQNFPISPNLIKSSSPTKLNAGFAEIEPDLSEEPRDQFATNSISPEDFEYGVYDGHHTYHEGEEKGTFWGAIAEEIEAAEPPTGFQGLLSWLFPPAIAAGVFFHVPGEYLYIGAGLFTIIFCIIEMDKPDKPHHFEPQIYNMERGARDKLINDYNTMDIWDFNEKYGDLWDFTVKKDDITKR